MSTDDVDTLLPTDPSLKLSTVADALAAFLLAFARRVKAGARSVATLGMHEAHAELLRSRLGALELRELGEHHVAAFACEGASLSGATVRKRLSTLHSALRLAQRKGALERVPPFPEVDYVYKPGKSHLRSFEEYQRLITALPRRRAEWVAVAVFTGMHPSDIHAWRAFEDADPTAPTPWMILRNTKNRKTDGLRVRMPEELTRVLAKRFRRLRVAPGAPVVERWSAGSRNHTLPAVSERVGLMRMNATALRHTCGSWIVRRVGLTKAAQDWMGHSSPAMLARVYAHALPLQLEECARELDSMEVEGAPRRPPVASRKRTGPGEVGSSPGPGNRTLRDKLECGDERRPARTSEQEVDGRSVVPRDRVELSTHGFSVSALAGRPRRPPQSVRVPPGATRRDTWKRPAERGPA